jgi:hypothetical protein
MGAQVPATSHAVAASPANHMPLARDNLAWVKVVDVTAHRDYLTNKFMPHYHGHWYGFLRPGIPVPNVHIGAAYGGAKNFNKDVIDADIGLGHILQPQARLRKAFHQCFHNLIQTVFLVSFDKDEAQRVSTTCGNAN